MSVQMSITEAEVQQVIDKECDICAEKYNTKKRRPVKCEYCPMEACSKCCERYILNENTVKCMNITCNKAWSRKYIASTLKQSFVNGKLKEHRKKIMFDTERAKFPETIDKISHVYELKECMEKLLSIYSNEFCKKNPKYIVYELDYRGCENEYKIAVSKFESLDKVFDFDNDDNYNNLHDITRRILRKICYAIHELQTNKIEITKEINKRYKSHWTSVGWLYKNQINVILRDCILDDSPHKKIVDEINEMSIIINKYKPTWNESYVDGEEEEDEKIATKKVIVKPCPTQSCNGFLNDNWHCILCNNTTCASCNEKKEEEHKCNPDTVETVKLLKRDTKSCPNCKTMIYKIDGCDQMWCTQCHTAFSWKSGSIETKIHNPHYYEWMRSKSANGQIPRNDAVADECGNNDINSNMILSYYKRSAKYKIDKDICLEDTVSTSFIHHVRHTIHMREVDLHHYTEDINKNRIKQFMMRHLFLNKKIDEKQYKMFLERDSKRIDKNKEIYQLFQTYIMIKSDILHRFMNEMKIAICNSVESIINNICKLQSILDETIVLKTFIDKNADEIRKTYNNVFQI